MDQWRREREAVIAAGQPDPYEGLDERGWQWLEARKPKIVEGKPKFDRPETERWQKKNVNLPSFRNKESSNHIGIGMC